MKKIIPIYNSVYGNGNNSMYVIVKFVGMRILYVQVTGKDEPKASDRRTG
jgi:hypothetical protein